MTSGGWIEKMKNHVGLLFKFKYPEEGYSEAVIRDRVWNKFKPWYELGESIKKKKNEKIKKALRDPF